MEGRMIILTPKARQVLAKLQEEKDSAQALVTSTLSRVGEADRALGNNPEGVNAADLEFEITRLRANLGKHQQRFEMLSTLVANIRRWLSEQKPNAVLSDWKPAKLKERSGESTFDAIDRVRTEIASLSRDLRDVRDAGLPREELYAQAAKWVATQAMHCTPKITATQKDFKIEFGQQSSFTNPAPDMVSYFCWYDGDAIVGLLCKEIDKLPVPKLVLTPADRDRRMSELKEALLRLERTEEQLIVLAEQDDHVVLRRPASSPEAILGVVVERAAKTTAAA
jgi:hypothetical protein